MTIKVGDLIAYDNIYDDDLCIGLVLEVNDKYLSCEILWFGLETTSAQTKGFVEQLRENFLQYAKNNGIVV